MAAGRRILQPTDRPSPASQRERRPAPPHSRARGREHPADGRDRHPRRSRSLPAPRRCPPRRRSHRGRRPPRCVRCPPRRHRTCRPHRRHPAAGPHRLPRASGDDRCAGRTP
ncbi:MAG: hypothetical protein FJ038_01010 [Chloroflexi bacterium]|nr:hypothetical protein [Chloroflexota bacterium]